MFTHHRPYSKTRNSFPGNYMTKYDGMPQTHNHRVIWRQWDYSLSTDSYSNCALPGIAMPGSKLIWASKYYPSSTKNSVVCKIHHVTLIPTGFTRDAFGLHTIYTVKIELEILKNQIKINPKHVNKESLSMLLLESILPLAFLTFISHIYTSVLLSKSKYVHCKSKAFFNNSTLYTIVP